MGGAAATDTDGAGMGDMPEMACEGELLIGDGRCMLPSGRLMLLVVFAIYVYIYIYFVY